MGIPGYLAGITLALLAGASAWPAAGETGANDDRLLSEIRFGLLYHDAGIWVAPSTDTSSIEPAGPDINAELLFGSPKFLGRLGSPRPHLGVTINTQGATSQAYLGLTWDWDLTDIVVFELAGGGGIHSGETDPLLADADEKPLGCRGLFRFSVGLGIKFAMRHTAMLVFDHASNGFLCDPNPGLDTVGLRYGYGF